jgi:hypothetical protein
VTAVAFRLNPPAFPFTRVHSLRREAWGRDDEERDRRHAIARPSGVRERGIFDIICRLVSIAGLTESPRSEICLNPQFFCSLLGADGHVVCSLGRTEDFEHASVSKDAESIVELARAHTEAALESVAR